EFVKRNGEFTVNIALIEKGKPILGIVYVPVTGALYFGLEGKGSYQFNTGNGSSKPTEELIKNATKLPLQSPDVYTIVASRSHNTEETEIFIEEKKKIHGDVNLISSGSSIKLCLVAEG